MGLFRFDNYASELTPATDWKPGDPWDQHYTQPGLDDRDQQIEDAISAIGLATQTYATIAARNASSVRPGQRAWVTATLTEYEWDGTGWVIMAEPLATYATTVSAGGGAITTLGAVAFKYTRHDGFLDYYCGINITTNGTGASFVQFSVPVALATTEHAGSGREVAVTGHALTVTPLTVNTLYIVKYDNSYPGGNGYGLSVQGRYQMTTRYS